MNRGSFIAGTLDYLRRPLVANITKGKRVSRAVRLRSRPARLAGGDDDPGRHRRGRDALAVRAPPGRLLRSAVGRVSKR